MNTWDLFISHASEDKELVAHPLAEALTRAGLAVWVDSFEIKLGDSIRATIDHGLAESAFGVVILSPNFFAKQWTVRELNGLFAMDDDDRRILPVWHQVGREEVRKLSPILADRRATSTKFGIDHMSREVAEAVLRGQDTLSRGGLTARMNALLDRGPDPQDVSGVLDMHPYVVAKLLGVGPGGISVNASLKIAGEIIDLAAVIGRPSGWDGADRHYFLFGPAATGDRDGFVDPRVQTAVEKMLRVHSVLRKQESDVSSPQDWHGGIVLAGRRTSITSRQRELRRDLRSRDVSVRTYDWLLDACVQVDREARRLGPRWGR